MADLRRNSLYNQKRTPKVAVFRVTEAELLAVGGAYVADLPERVLVTGVKTIPHVVSATAGANITVKVGATSIATNVGIATAAVKVTATPGYFATGGAVTINPGAVPPATGLANVEVAVEYVELDTVSGEYVG